MIFEKLENYTYFKLFGKSNLFIKCRQETIVFNVLQGADVMQVETLVNCLRDDGLLVYVDPLSDVNIDYNMEYSDEDSYNWME